MSLTNGWITADIAAGTEEIGIGASFRVQFMHEHIFLCHFDK